MSAQFFSPPSADRLIQSVAQAMASLDPMGPAPVLVVDSPFTAQALKAAVAGIGWPGQARGAPLPWSGSLDQAFELKVSSLPQASPPRSLTARRVQLAQQLLDHPGIADSLGGSPKAALGLAAKWVKIFDGWEWLEAEARPPNTASSLVDAPHLSADLGMLRALHAQNRSESDRATWMARHAGPQETPVWFCMAQSPSPSQRAMASLIWRQPAASIRVFAAPAIASLEALHEQLAPDGPISTRRLVSAQSMEESAWAALQCILDWRAQGIDDIGLVALDRKMLRRLRALLERAGESLADGSGWALDTTVAASAVTGLNDLLLDQATTQSVLEWVHSPFVRKGLGERLGFKADDRQRLDEALRAFGRVAPIRLKALSDQGLLPMQTLAQKAAVRQARQPLAAWAEMLLEAIEETGLESELAQDTAGQALSAAVQQLRAESISDTNPIEAPLWQALLQEALSQSRFVAPVADAHVRVCALSSLSWAAPKAVLVLGADPQRLPERPVAEFFEPRRFAEMGLANPPELIEAEGFGQLVSVWMKPLPMVFMACAEKPDSKAEFSNWIELLAMVRPDWTDRQNAAALVGHYELNLQPDAARTDEPTVFRGVLPAQISVTELQRLVDCPYQFYLQRLLGFAPVADLEEESPPTDLGSLMHQVLADATMAHQTEADWADWLEQAIDTRLARPFSRRKEDDSFRLMVPSALHAKLRAEAKALVPRLSVWLKSREQELAPSAVSGAARPKTQTETAVEREITALGILIKGRIDRWEETNGGALLIDFKTSDPKTLEKNIKKADRDVQLPLYAWLIGPKETAVDARYISIRRSAIKEIGLAQASGQPIAQLTDAVLEQVSQALRGLSEGAVIEPLGMTREKTVCDRCNVRGICRRDDRLPAEDDDDDDEDLDS